MFGVYYLNHKHQKEGFLFLGLSAALWVLHNLSIGQYEQAATCGFSTVTSLYGYWKWKRDERRKT